MKEEEGKVDEAASLIQEVQAGPLQLWRVGSWGLLGFVWCLLLHPGQAWSPFYTPTHSHTQTDTHTHTHTHALLQAQQNKQKETSTERERQTDRQTQRQTQTHGSTMLRGCTFKSSCLSQDPITNPLGASPTKGEQPKHLLRALGVVPSVSGLGLGLTA